MLMIYGAKKNFKKQITYEKNNFQISHTSYKIISEEGAILDTRKSADAQLQNILTLRDIDCLPFFLKRALYQRK